MTLNWDMGGNDLIVNSVSVGATAPGQAGTSLSGTELSVLDSVTAGTVTASKAVVVDSSKNIATFGNITSSGTITAKSGVSVPATAGAVAAGAPLQLFSANKIWITSDVPTHTATKGDLCINTGGSSSSTRMYVNNGTTTWIAFTTAS